MFFHSRVCVWREGGGESVCVERERERVSVERERVCVCAHVRPTSGRPVFDKRITENVTCQWNWKRCALSLTRVTEGFGALEMHAFIMPQIDLAVPTFLVSGLQVFYRIVATLNILRTRTLLVHAGLFWRFHSPLKSDMDCGIFNACT